MFDGILTAEALAVAGEYVAWRQADDWSLEPILIALGIPTAMNPSREQVVRLVAAHWLEAVAPGSRAVDAARRARCASRRNGRMAPAAPPDPVEAPVARPRPEATVAAFPNTGRPIVETLGPFAGVQFASVAARREGRFSQPATRMAGASSLTGF